MTNLQRLIDEIANTRKVVCVALRDHKVAVVAQPCGLCRLRAEHTQDECYALQVMTGEVN